MKIFFRPALRLLVLGLVLGSASSCKKSEETTVLGNWTKGNTFPGTLRTGAVSFIINNVAYVGTGIDANNTRYSDLYSYNAATNTWATLTPMPAAAGTRYYAVAFAVGNKGYVGTGYGALANVTPQPAVTSLSDFWEFDPSVNTSTTVGGTTTTTTGSWKQVADLNTVAAAAGAARYYAVGGSIAGGTYGYVGCGYDGTNWKKDFYRYNPSSNTWSTFASFPGDKRLGGFTFTLNNQMYVGGGSNNGNNITDFYSYNPTSDTWAAHRELKSQTTGSDTYDYSSVARVYGSAFVVGNLGYVTVGSNGAALTSTYVYDPSADTWTLKNSFRGQGRNSAVAFGIGSNGFVGLGGTSATARYDDFWKFAPDAAQE